MSKKAEDEKQRYLRKQVLIQIHNGSLHTAGPKFLSWPFMEPGRIAWSQQKVSRKAHRLGGVCHFYMVLL